MANLFDLVAKLTLDSSEYESGLDKAESKASKAGGAFKKGLGAAAKVGATAVGAAAAGMVAFGKSSVEAGMNFDSSMAQVAATMGKSVDEIGDLRQFAQEMGSSTAFSATQAADALNYMALAGYDADTSMQMLPNVLNLAAAGGIELASASDMVTDAQSALGLTLDETSELVDKMAMASSKSNTSVAQLGDAILTVGGTAKNLAGGTTELSTALGILADNGIKGAEGGTALRNIILSLSAPTDQAAKMMESLGLSAYDAEGNLRPMEDIFNDLNGALSGMTQGEQTEVLNTLFNKVDLKSANALLATSSERWGELSGAIDNASGSAQKMADTQLDNLSGDITLFKSALEGAQIAVSDVLSPALREFVQLGTDGISQITTAFQEGGFQGAADAAGEVLGGLVSKVIEYVPQIIQGALTLVQSLANTLMDNAPMILDAAMEVVSNILTAFSDQSTIARIATFGGDLLISLADGLSQNLPSILTTATGILTDLILVFTDPENLGNITDGAVAILTALGQGLTSSIDTLMSVVPEIIENLVLAITQDAPQILQAGLTLITSLADSLISALPTLIQAVPVLVEGLVNFIVNAAPMILTAGVQLITQLAQGLIVALPSLIASVPLIISSFEQGIVQMFPIILNAGIQLLQQLGYGILQTIPSLIAQIPMIIQALVSGFTGNLGTMLQTGVQLLVELGKGVIQGVVLFVTQIPQLVIEIGKAFLGGIPDMLDAGKQLATGLWDGIKGMFSGKKDISVTDSIDFSSFNEKSQEALDSFTDVSTSATDTANYVSTAFSDLGTAMDFSTFGTSAETAFTGISTSAETAAAGVTTSFANVGTGISTALSSASTGANFTAVTANAQQAAQQTIAAFSTVPEGLGDNWEATQSIYKDAPSFFQKTFEAAKESVLSVWGTLPDEFRAVWEQIKNVYKEAPTWFQTTFNAVRENVTQIMTGIATDATTWGQDMMDNFNTGIQNRRGALNETLNNVAQDVNDTVGFSEPKKGPLSDFHTYAPDMMNLFMQGIRESTPALRKTVEKSFDFRESFKAPEATVSSSRTADTSNAKMDAVLAILQQYLPELANRDIVLDSGVTVGALLPQIDSGLGQSYSYKARGNA